MSGEPPTVNASALLHTMVRTVVPILKRTPEYAQARAERRAKAWLDHESLSLGHTLAETVWARLEDLDS